VLIELGAKALLCVSNPRPRLGGDLELAVAQHAYTGDGYRRKPLGDSEITHRHEAIIKPGGATDPGV
jgi:hypothetical protein